MNLLIYSDIDSPRFQFICYQIFGKWYRWEYSTTTKLEDFLQFEGVSINYSTRRIKKAELFIPRSTILAQTGIQQIDFSSLKYNKSPAFFNDEIIDTDFETDILGAIFLFLSRYEEYLPYTPDQHGRFTAKHSWVFNKGLLPLPIVDIWVQTLHKALKRIYPRIPFFKRTFRKLLTYDVDMAWAYRHKGFLRSIGGAIKDVQNQDWVALKKRAAVTVGKESDPYQIFQYFHQQHEQYAYDPIYFFLLGRYSKHDKNISPTNKQFQQLIQQIASRHTIGIHPSYLSNDDPQQLATEIKTLETITQQPIQNSRQHFLILHLPTTYRQLIEYGIKHDYSMGYADAIGFRAGTSFPFYWYDLEKEEITNLLVHPFQVMDVTLKEYLHLSPQEAKVEIKKMIDTIKKVNGIFCSLWHNSSFSFIENWEEWREVYEFMLKYGGE